MATKPSKPSTFASLMSLTSEIAPTEDAQSPAKAKSAPAAMMDLALQRDEAEERAKAAEDLLSQANARTKELEQQLLEAAKNKGAIDMPLDQLHKVPGRQRKLTDEERKELKENLRQHPLANPITCQPRPGGGFDIVSGNNRYDLYCELNAEFGNKPTIKACLDDSPESVVEEVAFYANLLSPSLPAFEKFLGLKMVMERNPSIVTQEQLSEHTGITRSTVSEILRFEDLPAQALELLKKKPSALGARTAASMAALVQGGRQDEVIGAIERLVAEDSFTESEALALAKDGPKKEKPVRPEPETIRSGRKNYCTMIGTKKTLRVDFQTEEDRMEVESLVRELLKAQAARRKPGETN